jgi:protein-L-isoaspartate(D-aspartate) O-methyltransferase
MKEQVFSGIGMTSQRTRDRLAQRLQAKGISDRRVLEVIRHTPRHLFVDEALASRAYEDTALPIGHRQTISQPYIVARMTEALMAQGRPPTVLEVGTGSGYQSALLAQLVPKVYTVECIPELSYRARARIRKLRLYNVRFHLSDGSWGWPLHAPYDAIMVTAAPEEIPEPLLEQLAVGGRMLIPLGRAHGLQRLALIIRTSDCYEQQILEAVSFVPLVPGNRLA